jgi:uncharacterized membrane protein YdbT with pleckstrin-like domain
VAIEQIFQLLQKSDASGSKSTILKPLTWFISLLAGAIITCAWLKVHEWIIVFFAILVGIAFVVFLCAYVYCLFTNPDAIRSEKFSIQKMAIERGIFGDSSSGTFVFEKGDNTISLPSISGIIEDKEIEE